MFINDMFEADKNQQQGTAQEKSSMYKATNNAEVRRALEKAYRAFPSAKTDAEAMIGVIDQQDRENAEQEREIDQLEKQERELRRRQDALVKDLQDKEKRFRDQEERFREFNRKVAAMGVTPQQAAQAAVDFAQGTPKEPSAYKTAPAPVAKPAVAVKSKPAYNPSTGTPTDTRYVAVSQPEPAAAPAPQTAAEPTASPAIAGMAQQLQRPAQEPQKTLPGFSPTVAAAPQSANQEVFVIDPEKAQNIAKWAALRKVAEAAQQTPEQIGQYNLASLISVAITPDGQPKPLPPTFTLSFGPNEPVVPLSARDLKRIWDVIGDYDANEADLFKKNVLSNFRGTVAWLDRIGVQPNLNRGNQMDLGLEEDSWHSADGGEWHGGDNAWSSEHDQWTKEGAEMQQNKLSAGDPIVVVGNVEHQGATGEFVEYSPSGKFVVVDLYNYGKQAMNLINVKYNDYADSDREEADEFDRDRDFRNWMSRQDGDVMENYWQRLQRERDMTEHQRIEALLGELKESIEFDEDWQKVNKRDRTPGMSRKAVKAYRRENPGSKLQTAVTTKPSKLKKGSKASKRRKSFCARMKGMKKAHASAKTKRNPDSPINKALRRWNCESVEELQTMLENAERWYAEQLAEGKKKITAKDDPCWKGYHMVGTKNKGGREVPNCVPGKKGD